MSRRQTYSQLLQRDPLPAPPPPALEGVAAASRPGFPPNLAAGAPPAPAVSSTGRPAVAPPTREQFIELLADGLSDREIGRRFGRSGGWAVAWRDKFGLPTGNPQHANKFGRETPNLLQTQRAEAETAAFHAEHGHFQSYSDAAIRRFEAQCAVARGEVGRLIDITRQFFGDPVAGRGASVG